MVMTIVNNKDSMVGNLANYDNLGLRWSSDRLLPNLIDSSVGRRKPSS